MQPNLSQGVGGQSSTQAGGNIMAATASTQVGPAGSLQSSLAPGVYIYGQPQGANSAQPAEIHGLTPASNSMYPDRVNWNANHMYYQQHRYFSRYRWKLFISQSRHKATLWHRVRFIQPQTFCPECFTPRVLDSDDDDDKIVKSGNQNQGSPQGRRCVR